MKHCHKIRIRRRQGTAIVEFVMVLPLLAVVLALMFWFGKSMIYQQHVRMADRYAVWRTIAGAGMPDEQHLDEQLLAGKSVDMELEAHGGPNQALQGYVVATSDISQSAESLADRLFLNRFPRGFELKMTVDFPSDILLQKQFLGTIASAHVRDGVTWRNREARCEEDLCEMYFQPVDNALRGLPTISRSFGDTFIQLYLGGW